MAATSGATTSLASRADRLFMSLVNRVMREEGEEKPLKRTSSVGEITIEIVDTHDKDGSNVGADPQVEQDVVRLRRPRPHQRGEQGDGDEVGGHLKTLLDAFVASPSNVSSCWQLDALLSDLFDQLDFEKKGQVTKADFDVLCTILGLNKADQSKYTWRKSGIEWLSLYRPGHRTESPIRSDQLANVKYRGDKASKSGSASASASGSASTSGSSAAFLFTLGARPFWELWPERRSCQSAMAVDDFKRSLLQIWAHHRDKRLSLASILPLGIASKDLDDIDDHHVNKRNDDLDDLDQQCRLFRQLARRVVRRVRRQQAHADDDVVAGLRQRVRSLQCSLRLSEAQNLSLHVLLHKLAEKANSVAGSGPQQGQRQRRWRVMEESERQLEHLVRELKAMSQTEYPDVSDTNTNTNGNSNSMESQGMQESKMDNGPKLISDNTDKDTELTTHSMRKQSANLALDQSQRQLEAIRLELNGALSELDSTRVELSSTQEQLLATHSKLVSADMQINETKRRLRDTRRRRQLTRGGILVSELESTRDLLVATLSKIQHLEISKSDTNISSVGIHIDAEVEHEHDDNEDGAKSHRIHLIEVCVDESGTEQTKRPPWPSSSRQSTSSTKVLRPQTPASSSGLGSTPGVSPKEKSTKNNEHNDELVQRLRNEIAQLRATVAQAQRQSAKERSVLLLTDLLTSTSLSVDDVALEEDELHPLLLSDSSSDRLRVALLEEKMKEILLMLRSLNDMNISSHTLGNLVLESVSRSSDPLTGQVRVFAFLTHLYHSTRDFERRAAELELQKVLKTLEDNSNQLQTMVKKRSLQIQKDQEQKTDYTSNVPYIDSEL